MAKTANDQFLDKPVRPSFDEYFMNIAKAASTRSSCIRRQIGAIIVKDRRLISTGYNGTPRGIKNCDEGGCPRCNSSAESGTRLDECLCSHAEENAIVQAAYHGTSVKGGIVYTTHSPCLLCTKLILNSGITEVVYNIEYPLSSVSMRMLKQANITLRKLQL